MSIKSTAIACLVAVVLTGLVAYRLHANDVERVELRDATAQATAVMKQLDDDQAQCAKDKLIASKVSHGYEQKLSALNSQLNALRVRPSACVPVRVDAAPSAGGGLDGQTSTRQYVDGDARSRGINEGFLNDFAGRCEHYRIQLNALQDFNEAIQ